MRDSKKKILVSGGAGFLGSHLCDRLLEQGHDVLYFENIEGGHGGAANNEQRANLVALENTFLWVSLGGL